MPKFTPPIAGQPVIKGEKEMASEEDRRKNMVEEKTNELTDPNSVQSKFQRGETLEDLVHYSARAGEKPAKNIYEHAERDKKLQEERAAKIQHGKDVRRVAAERGISEEEAEKWMEDQERQKQQELSKSQERRLAAQKKEEPDKLTSGVDKPVNFTEGQSAPSAPAQPTQPTQPTTKK